MGSSGALTAAAFDLFCDFKNLSQLELKEKLAETENYFHGNSSGLDPLTIYLNKTLFVDGPEIMTVDDPKFSGQFALANSDMKRNTKTLVTYYKSQVSKSNFANALIELNEYNERAIHALLSSEMEALKPIMHSISKLQYQYFDYMIPKHMKNTWKAGLDTGDYSMKLSGAGGGGYFLVFGDTTSIKKKHSLIKL